MIPTKEMLIIGDNGMILTSSFLSNIAACSVIKGLLKFKTTVSGNLRSNAVTALFGDFHTVGAELTLSLYWSLKTALTDAPGTLSPLWSRPPPTPLLGHLCAICDYFRQQESIVFAKDLAGSL